MGTARMLIDIFFGGGIFLYIFTIWRDRKLKKNEEERVKKLIRELYLEEIDENIRVLNYIEKKCASKEKNPNIDFISGGLFFNVINYILNNLAELSIEKTQFRKLMSIKTTLENVLFWQDEFIAGTKGNAQLMSDRIVIQFYIPRIQAKVFEAKRALENNRNMLSATN